MNRVMQSGRTHSGPDRLVEIQTDRQAVRVEAKLLHWIHLPFALGGLKAYFVNLTPENLIYSTDVKTYDQSLPDSWLTAGLG
jgi:hypothetical protein